MRFSSAYGGSILAAHILTLMFPQMASNLSGLNGRHTLATSIVDIFSVASQAGTSPFGNLPGTRERKRLENPGRFELLQHAVPIGPRAMLRKWTSFWKPY
jgi:hypothetical protein